MKRAHLRRWLSRGLPAAYSEYASVAPPSPPSIWPVLIGLRVSLVNRSKEGIMRRLRAVALVVLAGLVFAIPAGAADPTWPKEVTFGLLSTESAAEITR